MLLVPEKVFELCKAESSTGVDGVIGDSGSSGGVWLWLTSSSGISSTLSVRTRRFLVRPLIALLIEFFGFRPWACVFLSVSLFSSDPEVIGCIFLDLYLCTEDVLEVAGLSLMKI